MGNYNVIGIRDSKVFSDEEQLMLKKARELPIEFDKDCPETTQERAARFRRVNPPRNGIGMKV